MKRSTFSIKKNRLHIELFNAFYPLNPLSFYRILELVINCMIIHHDEYQTRTQNVHRFEHLCRKPQLIYPNPQHTF